MTALEYLESIKLQYLAALAVDAVKPKPDYSIDGQTVSRASLRTGLFNILKEIATLSQFEEPFELKGQAL